MLAHQVKDNENKELLEGKGMCMGDVEEKT
jgi:hypothetical protein